MCIHVYIALVSRVYMKTQPIAEIMSEEYNDDMALLREQFSDEKIMEMRTQSAQYQAGLFTHFYSQQ